ncbi:hypothetical protein TSTA_059440 [Talaromyces stipitatus ATCC 10500]|uniref:Uncharacterized protein n=1 Tax=Talaromyces stipitatus (strain ATCC 10500 / CBS 375.48 / QM 6759 / NRRL 1006) TaxID=441959 RepID=B8MQN5_TALSN|nr:uncharacterized protein TSTA_059440 [Talaromyces stipitatus ATCC 10500]EED13458.1 hypothetical protein TSTA_059440 [Talaromyces stipitatus ATCC 10500]
MSAHGICTSASSNLRMLLAVPFINKICEKKKKVKDNSRGTSCEHVTSSWIMSHSPEYPGCVIQIRNFSSQHSVAVAPFNRWINELVRASSPGAWSDRLRRSKDLRDFWFIRTQSSAVGTLLEVTEENMVVQNKEYKPGTYARLRYLCVVIDRHDIFSCTFQASEGQMGRHHTFCSLVFVSTVGQVNSAILSLHYYFCTFPISSTVLGAEHPNTVTSMANLAFTWKFQGKLQDALSLMEKSSYLHSKVLGLSRPYSRLSSRALSDWMDKYNALSNQTMLTRKECPQAPWEILTRPPAAVVTVQSAREENINLPYPKDDQLLNYSLETILSSSLPEHPRPRPKTKTYKMWNNLTTPHSCTIQLDKRRVKFNYISVCTKPCQAYQIIGTFTSHNGSGAEKEAKNCKPCKAAHTRRCSHKLLLKVKVLEHFLDLFCHILAGTRGKP